MAFWSPYGGGQLLPSILRIYGAGPVHVLGIGSKSPVLRDWMVEQPEAGSAGPGEREEEWAGLAFGPAPRLPIAKERQAQSSRLAIVVRVRVSKEIVVLDPRPAAAGSVLGALKSSLPFQDAFLPVGRDRGAGDFE